MTTTPATLMVVDDDPEIRELLARIKAVLRRSRTAQLEQLDELSSNMAFSIASTMRFFRSLPVDYRHIVLDQRRIPVEDIGSGYRWLSEERLLAGLVVLLTVLTLSLLGITSVTRPLARLSRAARRLGDDLDSPPLRKSGPREVAATAVAFNRMQLA